MLQAGLSLVCIKLVMILLFLLFTSPVATHTIAQAALQSGLKPELAEKEGDA
jgi:multicomponent Na+:H+ antiporter subunit G